MEAMIWYKTNSSHIIVPLNMADEFYLTLMTVYSLGAVGNMISIAVFSQKAFQDSPTSLSHQLLCALETVYMGIVSWGITIIHQQILLTKTICLLLLYLMHVANIICNWMVVLVTIERLTSVILPLRVRILWTKRRILIMFFITSSFTLVLYSAIFIVTTNLDALETNSSAVFACLSHFQDVNLEVTRAWLETIFMHSLPCVILVIGNGLIILALSRSRVFLTRSNSWREIFVSNNSEHISTRESRSTVAKTDTWECNMNSKHYSKTQGNKDIRFKIWIAGTGIQNKNSEPSSNERSQFQSNNEPTYNILETSSPVKESSTAGLDTDDKELSAHSRGIHNKYSDLTVFGDMLTNMHETAVSAFISQSCSDHNIKNTSQEMCDFLPNPTDFKLSHYHRRKSSAADTVLSNLSSLNEDDISEAPTDISMVSRQNEQTQKSHFSHRPRTDSNTVGDKKSPSIRLGQPGRQLRRRERAMTLTLLLINFTFLGTKTPYFIHAMTLPGFPDKSSVLSLHDAKVKLLFVILASLFNVVSFLLYCMAGSKFRQELRQMFEQLVIRCKRF